MFALTRESVIGDMPKNDEMREWGALSITPGYSSRNHL